MGSGAAGAAQGRLRAWAVSSPHPMTPFKGVRWAQGHFLGYAGYNSGALQIALNYLQGHRRSPAVGAQRSGTSPSCACQHLGICAPIHCFPGPGSGSPVSQGPRMREGLPRPGITRLQGTQKLAHCCSPEQPSGLGQRWSHGLRYWGRHGAGTPSSLAGQGSSGPDLISPGHWASAQGQSTTGALTEL